MSRSCLELSARLDIFLQRRELTQRKELDPGTRVAWGSPGRSSSVIPGRWVTGTWMGEAMWWVPRLGLFHLLRSPLLNESWFCFTSRPRAGGV